MDNNRQGPLHTAALGQPSSAGMPHCFSRGKPVTPQAEVGSVKVFAEAFIQPPFDVVMIRYVSFFDG